jgi:hypothetical protein
MYVCVCARTETRYLRIQVEDMHNYDAALAYMRRLSFLEAERNLKLYCRSLVYNRPDEVVFVGCVGVGFSWMCWVCCRSVWEQVVWE